MNKIALSFIAVIAMSNLLLAEGDAVPLVVEEENNFYLGLGIAAVSTRDAATSLDFSSEKDGQDRLGNFTLLAGYDFDNMDDEYGEYFALEARYTTSFTDEDQVEMSGWSIFLKPQYTFEDDNGEKGNFKIYGLLGFGGVTLDGVSSEYSNGNPWVDVDDTGFQWGLGASYSFKDYADDLDISIFIDYTMLADEMEGVYYNHAPETNIDALTVGVIYKF